jgi:hypothetical protein
MSQAASSRTAFPAIAPERVSLQPGGLGWRLPIIGLVLGLGGLATGIATRAAHPRVFAFAWLASYLFFLSLALGSLFIVLIHHAVQASWSVVVRRLAECVAGTLPLFAVLFLPVVAGMDLLYPWALPEAAHDPLLHAKAAFLNRSFFLLRALVYFIVWSALSWGYLRGSRALDRGAGTAVALRLRRFSPPAILLLSLTQTFAAIDWAMSLSPRWYSTIFGVYFFAGSFVSAFAFLTLLVLGFRNGPLRAAVTVEHLHDLGKMIFAFTCFWAYIAFSQYFLIWYGNIPEETIWYQTRLNGSWAAVSATLALGHFIVPFFFLMGRTVKRNPTTLAVGAAWVLLMHLIDIIWMVMPSVHPEGPRPGPVEIGTFLAVGGLFLLLLGTLLRRLPLVPVGDPRLAESMALDVA